MLQKLQQKWKVSGLRFFLIIITFAIGGSLCGYLGKFILNFTTIDKGALWFILYVILVTLLWPICVLLISIPFGQFSFFKKYIRKIVARMSGAKGMEPKIRLAIFASGTGSNALKILDHFKNNDHIEVALVVSNRQNAAVLNFAKQFQKETLHIERHQFLEGDGYATFLKSRRIDRIILAGFLWKVPASLIRQWPNKIVNIHPALLPKYGGQGMYGSHVHQAVIDAGENQSGITIHLVDEFYDHGKHLYQASCPVTANDNPESLAQKIHLLEHQHYPPQIEKWILQKQ